MDSLYELIKEYPHTVAAPKALKLTIKKWDEEIKGLETLRELWMNDIQKLNFKLQPAYIAYLDDYIERKTKEYQKEQQKCLWWLNSMSSPLDPKKKPNEITPERIARAKEYPIHDMVDVVRGSFCKCPFHDDHHPSMHIYRDNHAYCYACNTRADAIDMWMKIHDKNFKEAVIALAP